MSFSRLDKDWACDDVISMPVVSAYPRLVSFGGFAFGEGGLCHDVSAGDLENMKHPPIAPYSGNKK